MDRRIILECGEVHRVCYSSFLFCKAALLRLTRFMVEKAFLDGADAVDFSFGGDEKAVSEFFEFCRTNGLGWSRCFALQGGEAAGRHPSVMGIQKHP